MRDELARSFARTFELGALYGTGNPPSSWPTGGLTAAANTHTYTHVLVDETEVDYATLLVEGGKRART